MRMADGPRLAVAAGIAYLPVAAAVLRYGPRHHRHDRFGAANAATLLRAVLVCLTFGLAIAPTVLTERSSLAWLPTTIAVLALGLDAADGRLARRQGLESPFGQRFDVEVDALMTLALCALAAALGTVPPWILAAGLLRYAFLATAWVFPALAAPLPDSQRRRLVGGAQGIVLALVLVPTCPPAVATALAAASLAALVVSFATDTVWLLRGARSAA